MNFLTFLFAFIIFMFLISCYDNSDFSAQDIYNGLKNTEWVVESVKDGSATKNIKDYNVHFDKLNVINIFVDVTNREGSWAVYEGFNGGILQVRYSDGNKDVLSLDGNWNIYSFDYKTMILIQNNIEIFLTIKK